jgi:hypothetical protein
VHRLTPAILTPALLALAGCGEPSKSKILSKAENAESKADLRAALGEPDDVNKLGSLEQSTYQAANGQVTFVITGETVRLKAAGGESGQSARRSTRRRGSRRAFGPPHHETKMLKQHKQSHPEHKQSHPEEAREGRLEGP